MDSTGIENEDEDNGEKKDTTSVPESFKRLENDIDSKIEIDSDNDGKNEFFGRKPSIINRRDRRRFFRIRETFNISVSSSSIQSDSNHPIINREWNKVYSIIPKLNDIVPVLSTSSTDHDNVNDLANLLGLHDQSKIDDSDSDDAEKYTSTQSSKPSITQYLLS